jgi:hypothetical protein
VHAPGRGKGAQGEWQHPFDHHQGAPRADGRHYRHWSGTQAEGGRAIGSEEDVDLDGNPPLVAVLRADRAGGDAWAPRSRGALKLAQMAVGALPTEG